MKTFRNLFVLILLLLVSLIFHSYNSVLEQQNNEQRLLSKANLLSLQYPQEKIYLHLDRPSYFVGEDIWFKAYLLNSPIPNCNIYIELLNSSGDVIDKKINWAQNGLAYGDFHLNDSLTSGLYQIRAYTNWMRNFDDSWFFRKDIIIWNRRDKSVDPFIAELKSKDINLQFLPEGGTLVANMKNRVAFKAVDKNGKGISVQGEIIDDNGNKIVDFKSGFKGMGSFVFEPEEERRYEAIANFVGNISVKVDLPTPQTNAIKLAVEPNDPTKISIQISANSSQLTNNQIAKYLVVGQTSGQICYRKEITITENNKYLEIGKSSLPTGIIKFTLFDNDMIPKSERLVFVNHHDYIDVDIVPEKLNYLTRENVQFDVKTLTKEGILCLSNLSMSVYNPESSIDTEEYANNILTQFLLNSELKGTIEDPAWYFKDDSLSTFALDNLMLTQGYRYFEWEEIMNDNLPEIEYQPEESLQLRGKVSNWLTKRPVVGCKVTMMSVKSLLSVSEETTDSLGNFVFSDLFFNDTVYVSLQAGEKKEKRKYWLDLDYRSSISPQPGYLPVNYQYNNKNQYTTSWYLGEINSDLKNRKWHLSDTILLGDINIVTKKREMDDGHSRPYLDADYVLDVSEQDAIYSDVFEMIENTSAYMRNFMRHNPQFFLDGVPVESDFITGLQSSWFDKIEAVRLAPTSGGFRPGLYFYTNRGETQKKDFDGLGLRAGKITGYSVIRKFYSPVYESRELADTENDFRNTLYWNPIVRTDSTGVAQVSFYNSDESGTMQIVVEGITSDGKLCRGVGKYSVKNDY